MTNTDDRDRTARRFGALLLGYLAVTVGSTVGGILIGGWLAFETDHWQEFKAVIEGLGDGAVMLAVGLVVVAVVVGLVVVTVIDGLGAAGSAEVS